MSTPFSLVIISKNELSQEQIQECLQPFDAQAQADSPYTVFRNVEEELSGMFESMSTRAYVREDGTMTTDEGEAEEKNLPVKTIALRELFPSVQDYARHCGYDYIDEKGAYGHYENPNGKWSWYVAGGSFERFFRLRDETANALEGYAASTRAADWDLGGQREMAALRAGTRYDQFFEALAGAELPPAKKAFFRKYRTLANARSAYEALESTSRLMQADPNWLHDADPGEEFACTREQYQERARLRTAVPFAILRDGKWLERGSVGLLGSVQEHLSDEAWAKKVAKLYDKLKPEHWVTVLEYHP
jgi:hypothetical protein